MKKQNILNSPKLSMLRRKKKRALKIKIGIGFFVLLALFLGLAFVSRIPKLNINQINVGGNAIVETNDIKNIVTNDLSGYYFWLFPKTNFLIYPKVKIKSDLVSKYKRLKDVSISIENVRTLDIAVSEYEGKYLWCGTQIPIPGDNSVDSQCYFMDESGYIFDQAPYFSGNVYFKFYGDAGESGNAPIGTYYLKDDFTEITTFENNLKELGLNPTAFWPDTNNGEADFSLSGNSGTSPRIIFKIDADYDKLTENLQAAISTEPLRTELQRKFSSLLYIDLRFNDKVYYKFSAPGSVAGSEQVPVSPAQATAGSQ